MFYRVHKKDCFALGMYSEDGWNVLDDGSPEMPARHPEPWSDSALLAAMQAVPDFRMEHWYFGFSSVRQFRNWLYNDQWLIGLTAAGFVLGVYRHEHGALLKGNTQAICKRHALLRVEERSLLAGLVVTAQ